MNWIIILMVLSAGVATSIQAAANGKLGERVGLIEAAFISFMVGTICLSLLLFFMKKGNISLALEGPKWHLIGGALGAFYILIMVFAVPRIGITAAILTLIIGQLTCSTIIDHFGLTGNKPIPVDFKRAGALLFMGLALFLFFKK
ncbi:MAG TPA: DMT family transporter [Cytophagaceae bacterium]|jgi:transporter family-2 protein